MANEQRILPGKFKEIPIRIVSANVVGGRKTVKHEFPNRDTQTVEDLGLKPRAFKLEILVSDIGKTVVNGVPQQEYFDYRNRLLAGIEDKSPGVLIHPLFGRIENVVATTFSLSETFSNFGLSVLSVSFEVTDDTGIPVLSTTAISQIAVAQSAVDLAVVNDITDNYAVFTRFKNNFGDAADKINQVIDSAVEATSFVGASADKINEFNSFIGSFSANVNSLVTNPANLSLSISNLFSNINGLFGTVESTAEAFKNLFGFGDNDEENIDPSTAGRIQRRRNRAILNGSVNAEALSYAYLAVSQVTFETVAEIDEAAAELEVQYQAVVTSEITQSVKDALTEARVIVQKFFDDTRLTAKQVIAIFTTPTTARLLTYQYYGDTELATEIIALNSITDVSFVSGDLDILTT